jgi:hypothetical protein
MELAIAPTDDAGRWGWTIVYEGESGKQTREYQLVVVDAARGRYQIDERNGIVLESRLIGGTLYEVFEVEGTRLATRQRLEGLGTADERISIEILTVREADATRTGGGEAPEVRSWGATSLQRAELRRAHR